ncbi:hydrolase [Cesiribacter sp. SM1]|uniref:hydrolase n=1 Tax=Cesiribacter sp. SM1 TaxID=2861196 RepID=UPI001CD49BCF|nr:hydrolase [Cesiribacter sp. SM1]
MAIENNSVPNVNYRSRFADVEYASPELLNPGNHALILIDHEGQMAFAMEGVNKTELRNNLALLGYYTRLYDIPVILSTIGERMFSGPIIKELRDFYPDAVIYDRMSLNLWEDKPSRDAVIATGKKKLVFAGLWTDVCLAFPVISALKAGYEVYFITDASGSVSKEAHDMAIQRMIQAGAIPMTSVTYISENIRDYSRQDNATPEVAKLMHEGFIKYISLGIGADYADYMVPSYGFFKGFPSASNTLESNEKLVPVQS